MGTRVQATRLTCGAQLPTLIPNRGSWSTCELGATLHAAQVRKTVATRRVRSVWVSRSVAPLLLTAFPGSTRVPDAASWRPHLAGPGWWARCVGAVGAASFSSVCPASTVRSSAGALRGDCMLPRFFQSKTPTFEKLAGIVRQLNQNSTSAS